MNVQQTLSHDVEIATFAATLAANVLVQSTLIIIVGLVAIRLMARRGAAVHSSILRMTMVAVLLCPLASMLIEGTGIEGLRFELPRAATSSTIEQRQAVRGTAAVDTTGPLDMAGSGLSRTPAAERSLADDVSSADRLQRPLAWSGSEGAGKPATARPADSTQAPAMAGPVVGPAAAADTVAAARPAPPPSTRIPSLGILYRTAVGLWGLLAVLLLLRLSIAHRLLGQTRRRCRPAGPSIRGLCQAAATSLGVPAPEVLVSPRVASPCLVGLVRPAILMPQGDLCSRDVLLHELAHLRRRDCAWQAVGRLLTAALWMQPLAWWLVRKMEQVADEVCDDIVVAQAEDRGAYARRLVDIAERYQPAWQVATAGVGIATFKSSLAHRVLRILDTSRSLSTRTGIASLLTIVIMGASSLFAIGLIGVSGRASVENRPTTEKPTAQVPTKQPPAEQGEPLGEATGTPGASLVIRGRVLDPAGRAVDGATVFVGLPQSSHAAALKVAGPLVTQTDSDGTFRLTVDKQRLLRDPSSLPEGMLDDVVKRGLKIGASAAGYGGNWLSYNDLEPGAAAIVQLVPEATIQGRLVNIEGYPLKQSTVTVDAIEKSPTADIEPWLESLADGIVLWTASANHQHVSTPPEILGVSRQVTTDDEGRFSVSGVGRDRIVRLIFAGTASRTIVRSVARSMEPVVVTLPPGKPEFHKVFGASFEFLAEPARLITGIVRDASSGEPLVGARVESYKLAGSELIGRRDLRTKTDAQGRFRIAGMPKGKGNELLVIPGDEQPYFMRQIEVPSPGGLDPVDLDIPMHRGVWITGRVTSKKTGAPAMATLYYLPWLNNEHAGELPEFTRLGNGLVEGVLGHQHQYTTRRDGSYRLVGLPGRAIIAASSGAKPFRVGYGASEIEGLNKNGTFDTYRAPLQPGTRWPNAMKQVDVPMDVPTIRCDLELDPGMDVKIKVRDPAGKPLGGVQATGLDGGAGDEQAALVLELDSRGARARRNSNGIVAASAARPGPSDSRRSPAAVRTTGSPARKMCDRNRSAGPPRRLSCGGGNCEALDIAAAGLRAVPAAGTLGPRWPLSRHRPARQCLSTERARHPFW